LNYLYTEGDRLNKRVILDEGPIFEYQQSRGLDFDRIQQSKCTYHVLFGRLAADFRGGGGAPTQVTLSFAGKRSEDSQNGLRWR